MMMSTCVQWPGAGCLLLILVVALIGCSSPADAGIHSGGRRSLRAGPAGDPRHGPGNPGGGGVRSLLEAQHAHGGHTLRCRHVRVEYVSSQLEQLWLDNIQEWQHDYCTQHMAQQANIDALARAVAAVDASKHPVA